MFWRLQQLTPKLTSNFRLVSKQSFWCSIANKLSLETFSDIVMPPELLKDLTSRFPTLTEIQKHAIDKITHGKDLIGVAKTGSGKTLAYGLPVLLKLSKEQSSPNALPRPRYLIIAPTRQLSQQIQQQLSQVCSILGLKIGSVYGGQPRGKQLFALRKGIDVLVATPGRLLDFILSEKISVDNVRYLTLDEADRILEVGYEEQILKIAQMLKAERQTTLFSATWDNKVKNVFRNYMRNNPEYVQIGQSKLSVNLDIKQLFRILEEQQKANELINIINKQPNQKFIIFVNMKIGCRKVQNLLSNHNIKSSILNGDLDQRQRNANLNYFKNNSTKILIATDVAARGLDINDVNYVINYDVPDNIQSYIHRIGRTARAGKQGTSITFLNWETNLDMVQELVRLLTKHNLQLPKQLSQILPYLSSKIRKTKNSKDRNGEYPRQIENRQRQFLKGKSPHFEKPKIGSDDFGKNSRTFKGDQDITRKRHNDILDW